MFVQIFWEKLLYWILGIGFSEKYGQKETDALPGGRGMQGEWSSMGLALLRWVSAGMEVEVGRFRRLEWSSPWV